MWKTQIVKLIELLKSKDTKKKKKKLFINFCYLE